MTNWQLSIHSTKPSHDIAYAAEPALAPGGGLFYRHYYITGHAIDRYRERVGGDLDSLVADLECAGLFDINRTGIHRRVCASVARHERAGGYALQCGEGVFLARPGDRRHVIVTTLRLERLQRH